MSLSVLSYNAPLLAAATEQTKHEIACHQNRVLQIINIAPTDAEVKYNILPINDFLDKECASKVARILRNPVHPITRRLEIRLIML